ncbi:MAG: hypothetical protein ACLPN5_09480 [Roseiarcus sp.]
MTKGNVVNWGAQSVRSAVFTNAFDSARVDELFFKAFEQQPSSYQGPPPGIPFAPSQAAGVTKLGQLTTQKLPGRVDFILTPISQLNATVPTFDNYVDAIEKIKNATNLFIESIESIVRLALIVELGISVGNVREANRIIADILPFAIELQDELDFALQLSRRFPSTRVPPLEINCLRRWSVTQMQQLIMPPLIVAGGATAQPLGASQFVAQLLLDVNTVPEARVFTGAQAGLILRELHETVDLVRRGQEGGWGHGRA